MSRLPGAGPLSSRTAAVVAVLLAAVLVSASSLGHELVFDDHMLVGGNAPVLRGEAPLLSAFTYKYWGAADEASPNELYRPVTILSLALNARLTGLGPRACTRATSRSTRSTRCLFFSCSVRCSAVPGWPSPPP